MSATQALLLLVAVVALGFSFWIVTSIDEFFTQIGDWSEHEREE